ncbi:MAG: anthranilate synthase component I family protein, partial [Planctomycetota bacterium]
MTTGAVAANRKTVPCKLHHKRIRISADLAAMSEIFADLESPSILGGNISKKDADRFSCWAAGPKEVLEFRTGEQEPFAKLQEALSRYKLDEGHEEDLPTGIFCGGWIGYFSYELGRHIERLPETTIDDVKMPLIRLCFYDRVVCYDHIEKDFWLIALELPDDAEKPGDKLAGLEQLLSKAREVSVTVPLADDIESVDFSNIRCNMDKDYYLQAIEKIKRYIYDGDVYQINFSQRFECDYKARPIELFHWQNYYNPSPYAAYIDGGSFHIVSASPEMFATIQDGAISTKPIKGTRPRVNENSGKDRQANSSNFDELVNSEKEQAELNMIVDLERNDVARICEPGTRTVIQPRTIESYPTVFHAVATVAGKLKSEASFCDILRAMFPG